MESNIRAMTIKDKPFVVEMMRIFYSSPAVFTNGSEEIFSADVDNCINGSPYLEGYVAENSKGLQGYIMIAKSFSTEFGKPCIWIEDIFVKNEYRGQGLGKELINFITNKYADSIFRLEVEDENEKAVELYKKCGFTFLPYLEMKK